MPPPTEPTAGEIELLDLPQPEKRSEALARVGAIVEEPRFHPHLTGRENLAIAAAAGRATPRAGSTSHSRASA